MWQENTKTQKTTQFCSTVLSEARKPVNSESPRKMLHWFGTHLLGIGPQFVVWVGLGLGLFCLFVCFAHKHSGGLLILIPMLSILHFLANLVAEDLVPVDLGAGDRQLPA